MCQRAMIRVWQTAETVQQLKDMIGDDIVINESYKGQEIKPSQCLCCVDLGATAWLLGLDSELVAGDYWFKKKGIDRK